MNQSLIFNNDLTFNHQKQAWVISALHGGQMIYICMHNDKQPAGKTPTAEDLFDWEELADEWLASNELDHTQEIWL